MPFSFRAVRLTAGILATAFLLAGCGDDGSSRFPADHPAAFLPIGDFQIGDYGSESSTLMLAIQHAGFPLDTSSATDSASIASLLAGKDILFLPEFDADFDGPTQAVVTAWVAAGGTIVMAGGYSQFGWVNTAFGWNLTYGDGFYLRHPMPKTAAARHTPFANGPSSIPGNDGGSLLDIETAPDDAIAVYLGEDGDNDASVAILPYGDGRVVYFAWDWYDGKPLGIQDGGWDTLLKSTAGF